MGRSVRYDVITDWYVTWTESWPAGFVCDPAVAIMAESSTASGGWTWPAEPEGPHVSLPEEAPRSWRSICLAG
jgi:hypothetical protein